MSGQITAAEGAILRGADATREAHQDLDKLINDLRNKLSTVGSYWKGSSATQFTGLMARWEEQQKRITRVLDTFEQNLRSSQSTYTQHDDAAQSSFSKLGSGL
ncbi:MAG: WXG100 family type VII secretion target [Micrococcales bacterium]|nr:WXG100 family type VII secretion target [Micrococcales bacterium]